MRIKKNKHPCPEYANKDAFLATTNATKPLKLMTMVRTLWIQNIMLLMVTCDYVKIGLLELIIPNKNIGCS